MSSIMADRFVKSDDKKNMLYVDANILYGHSMNQPVPYNEIDTWNGHPDLYLKK